MNLTSDQWQVLFQEHEASGVSQAEFCANKGISYRSFSCRKYRESLNQKSALVPRKKLSKELNLDFPSSSLKSVISILTGGMEC